MVNEMSYMKLQEGYPTPQHQSAAEAITRFFADNFTVDAVLLVNSCARGRATRDSCLDMNVLVNPKSVELQHPALEAGWNVFETIDAKIQALKRIGAYSEVHLDIVDGVFAQPGESQTANDGYQFGREEQYPGGPPQSARGE